MNRHVPAFLVAVALVGGGAVAADLNPRTIQKASAATMAGSKALQENDLARASELFEEALALVPRMPDAQMGLGHVAFARRQYEAALDRYTKARDEIVLLNKAAHDREQRQYEDAVRLIPRLRDEITGLQKIPSANVEQMVRDLERQIAALELVRPPARPYPDEPSAGVFFHRGNALHRLGRLDEALADWATCARLDPKFAPVHNNLAVVHWKLGHREQARVELAEAKRLGVAVNPEFEKAVDAMR